MFLTKDSLLKIIKDGSLLIDPYSHDSSIKDSSVMLHLGSSILKLENEFIDIKDLESVNYTEILLQENGYILEPGEFILVKTLEKVTMPENYIGWIETRGSLANIGLQSHFCDAHIDPGSSLHITLQIKNNSKVKIKIYPKMYLVKMYISQMI